jgi:hypothetical protein
MSGRNLIADRGTFAALKNRIACLKTSFFSQFLTGICNAFHPEQDRTEQGKVRR